MNRGCVGRCVVLLAWMAIGAMAATTSTAARANGNVHHVAALFPWNGQGRELGVDRPQYRGTLHPGKPMGSASAWRLQATVPDTGISDLAFASALVGYAADSAGRVLKTVDGGDTWISVMNLGSGTHWLGVAALDEQNVVVSGCNDADMGFLRWSHDGGATWSNEIVLTTQGNSRRIRFANRTTGLVLDFPDYVTHNLSHTTTNGGATTSDWGAIVVQPDNGWFDTSFSLLPNGHARASGPFYCDSLDSGLHWSCRHSVDSVFDGPVHFLDDNHGWVGGGAYYPTSSGWLHRTLDGGRTWSDRTLDTPWPIHDILFPTAQTGWAIGGNSRQKAGGAFFSADGGRSWAQDLETNGVEMTACSAFGGRVWCAGSNNVGSRYSEVYTRTIPDDVHVFADGFDE